MLQMPDFPPIKYDLQTRFGSIYGNEELQAIQECLTQDAPTSGKKTEEFETEFARYCGTKFAIACNNGTAALILAYKAINLQPGDEVITTPITWIATAAAAVTLGASIKFCDVDPTTLNMDPSTLESLITPKTKAICPVHLYGQPADMDLILEIAHAHQLPVIEDAAHTVGGKYKGKMAGNLGDIAIFSFHEQKNMSTLGEGGMVTTNNPAFFERARSYKSHCARVIGKSTKYLPLPDDVARDAIAHGRFWMQDFDDCGYNFRMNDMSATVGLCQLKKLDAMNSRRWEIAKIITDHLTKMAGIVPARVIEGVHHVYHLYPIFLASSHPLITRDQFIFTMRANYGIKCGIHYMPLVQTLAFQRRGHRIKECPVACERWQHLVTLPIHPRMEAEHLDYMLNAIHQIMT